MTEEIALVAVRRLLHPLQVFHQRSLGKKVGVDDA